jgi:hypothetical protein
MDVKSLRDESSYNPNPVNGKLSGDEVSTGIRITGSTENQVLCSVQPS